MTSQTVGGGAKKILYTLQTVQSMGVGRAAKALTAKNACKACGLGMGGQLGGMTNELHEFPSVCNKSVQAQSSDTRAPIPQQIFEHSFEEFRELSARELDRLGRLNFPLYKAKNDEKYRVLDWDHAMEIAANRLRQTSPDRSFFYASGRSSNEAGFLFQLLARCWGTNNVNNCSYYCHQASGVALAETIGSGMSTVELADLALSDLIVVIGANPASNHPRFIHQLQACRERGGNVIVINPAREPGLVKFAVPKSPKSMMMGGSEIASLFLQPKIGTDVSALAAIAQILISMGVEDKEFIANHCEDYAAFKQNILSVELDDLAATCGIVKDELSDAARMMAKSKSITFAWGMGLTHHLHGVENIEQVSNLALLLGMIGKPGAGLLPLRGHSNVQGIGTIGVKPVLPQDVFALLEKNLDIALPKQKGMDTMACMHAAKNGEIDLAVLMGGNLWAANPNADWAEKALDNIGFKLSLTTTLNQSHFFGAKDSEMLILPVTARDEEWEPTTQESMFNFVRMSDGGIDRLDNVRPETHILADLAQAILPNSPIDFARFKSHKEIRKAIAGTVPGLEELRDIDIAKKEFHIRNRIMHTPTFNTPSGKARFRTVDLPNIKKSTTQGGDAGFQLSTIRSEGQFNSIIYEEADTYRGTKHRWSILMNAKDIVSLGLKEGEAATVSSDNGEMKNVQVYKFDIPEGNVLAYYPEANILTGTQTDPRSKTPAFKSTPVRIVAAS